VRETDANSKRDFARQVLSGCGLAMSSGSESKQLQSHAADLLLPKQYVRALEAYGPFLRQLLLEFPYKGLKTPESSIPIYHAVWQMVYIHQTTVLARPYLLDRSRSSNVEELRILPVGLAQVSF
jgi:hypothetical protein